MKEKHGSREGTLSSETLERMGLSLNAQEVLELAELLPQSQVQKWGEISPANREHNESGGATHQIGLERDGESQEPYKRVPEKITESNKEQIVCKRCSTRLEVGSRYCDKCGLVVDENLITQIKPVKRGNVTEKATHNEGSDVGAATFYCRKCKIPIKVGTNETVFTCPNCQTLNSLPRRGSEGQRLGSPAPSVSENMHHKSDNDMYGMKQTVGSVVKMTLDRIDSMKTGDLGEVIESPLPAQLMGLRMEIKAALLPRETQDLFRGMRMVGSAISLILRNEKKYKVHERAKRIIQTLRDSDVLRDINALKDAEDDARSELFETVKSKLNEVLRVYE